MRQSIVTKYHGPTDKRGSRVSAASSSGHRIILEWDDALNTDENHIWACGTLARKLDWHGRWHAGALPNGCVFVNEDHDSFIIERQRNSRGDLIGVNGAVADGVTA